ncbi:hypothetical protein BDZ97DRAFT_1317707 [Flammula alnicola]|nr:hypothetical protein BDZ97DRAFT_1317707 [Flammula alnicola]
MEAQGEAEWQENQASNFLRLRGPHRDAKAMHDLLIDVYKYDPTDVVLLIDDGDPDQVQPIRENILSEIKLVKDAREGDKFFFHCENGRFPPLHKRRFVSPPLYPPQFTPSI